MNRRSQQGSTLIELLAATIIIGIISYALTESLVSGLNNAGDTKDRLTGSIDRQRVASAFVADVQSAQSLSLGGQPCGVAVAVGTLAWTDNVTRYVVSYVVVDGELVRRPCTDGKLGHEEVLAEIDDGFVPKIVEPGNRRIALRMCPVVDGPACENPDYEVTRPRDDGLPRGYEVVATQRVTS